MIQSMTGYGRAQQMLHGRELTVEMRAVNNRYLDLTVKLPRVYGFAEDAVKQRIKAAVGRGKVDVYITINDADAQSVSVSLNRPVLEGYLQALRTMAEDYQLTDDLTVSAVSRIPDIFKVERPETDEDAFTADLLSVVDQALERFNQMRRTEGAAMEADLRSRAATVLALTERIEARSPVTVAEYRARLEQKMREVLDKTGVDETRLLTEAAIFADKVAVDEETVRLRSHLQQLDNMLTAGGAVGRKLDFLLQEFGREANTIGSKGNDLEQARTVVELKAELEKIREQVQNIE